MFLLEGETLYVHYFPNRCSVWQDSWSLCELHLSHTENLFWNPKYAFVYNASAPRPLQSSSCDILIKCVIISLPLIFGTKRAGDFWSESVLLILDYKAPFLERLNDIYFQKFCCCWFWVFSYQLTLHGRGVRRGEGFWLLAFDRWKVTCEIWHVTHETFFLSLF